MATKAKMSSKKPSRIKREKTLKPVKPLDAPTESLSLNFTKIQYK